MANYAYISLHRVPSRDVFEQTLRKLVPKALDERWAVRAIDFDDGGPMWIVHIPGSAAPTAAEARRRCLAPGDDVGFLVALQADGVAFRHGPNSFEAWAQGRLQEEMADFYERKVFYDSTDRSKRPGTREYRTGTTFRDYLAWNFKVKSPPTAEDERFLERYRKLTPEGFW